MTKYQNKPFNNIENLFKIKQGYGMVSYESGLSILNEKLNFISDINKKMGYIVIL